MAAKGSEGSVSGGCLCGAVRFEIELPTLLCVHCHCTMCRRHHGAGYVTWFTLPRSRWRVTAGGDVLRRHASSDHAFRSFCSVCGSSLFFETSQRADQIDVVLANMDGPIDRAPQLHIFFDDRVDWVEVGDFLPRLGGDAGMEPL